LAATMRMRRCLFLLAFTTTLFAVSVHASPCAPSHTLCGAGGNNHHHRGFESGDLVSSVCCPSDTHVCQRTAHAHRCVAKVEAEACRSCCGGGACTFATASLLASPLQEDGRALVPEIKALQCCGVSGEQAYCCPTRASPAAAAEVAAAAAASSSASSSSSLSSSSAASTPKRATGFMQPTAPQQCKAVPNAWECVDLPSSVMQVTVSLAMWQLILCIVGGVLCCGALTGGGHRYHGGHCNDDCQACTAFLGGCLLFQCCRGGKGAGEPLLG